jgi:hypothetical protein
VLDHLHRALQAIAKQPVPIQGSGRTDTGVHALGQVACICKRFIILSSKIPSKLMRPERMAVAGGLATQAGIGALAEQTKVKILLNRVMPSKSQDELNFPAKIGRRQDLQVTGIPAEWWTERSPWTARARQR